MNWPITRTLIIKDLTIFFRNKFFAVVTVLGLVFFTGIYLVLPSSVDPELRLALYSADSVPTLFLEVFAGQQITIEALDSEQALMEAVEDGDYAGGVFLTEGLVDQMAAGEETQITVYFSANAPQELSDAVTVLVGMVFNEISNQFNPQPLNVQISVEILGFDLQGAALPIRKRMLPLLAVFMLITETLGLASLFAEERARETLRALLVTPVRPGDLFLSKGIMGTGLAFVQVMVVMLVAGALRSHPLLIVFHHVIRGLYGHRNRVFAGFYRQGHDVDYGLGIAHLSHFECALFWDYVPRHIRRLDQDHSVLLPCGYRASSHQL